MIRLSCLSHQIAAAVLSRFEPTDFTLHHLQKRGRGSATIVTPPRARVVVVDGILAPLIQMRGGQHRDRFAGIS